MEHLGVLFEPARQLVRLVMPDIAQPDALDLPDSRHAPSVIDKAEGDEPQGAGGCCLPAPFSRLSRLEVVVECLTRVAGQRVAASTLDVVLREVDVEHVALHDSLLHQAPPDRLDDT